MGAAPLTATGQDEKAEERGFRDKLTILHEVTNDLSKVSSVDDLCRRAVELGRSRLGFDRLSVWFVAEDEEMTMVGSWGTDENGKVVDERNRRQQISPNSLVNRIRRESLTLARAYIAILNSKGEVTGHADHAVAAMWDGETVVGYLSTDNLIGRTGLTDEDCELLTLYAAAVGHLCSQKRAEEGLRRREEAERTFREQLTVLHEVTNELSMATSFDALCRQAVELGRSRLGFDRLSLWFVGDEPETVVGSFGTDEQGALRDEREMRHDVAPGSMIDKILTDRISFVSSEDLPVTDSDSKVVGRAKMVIDALWNGQDVIGYISADNLLEHRDISADRCELLRLYGSALGHLCSQKRAEEALRRSEDRHAQAEEIAHLGHWSRDSVSGHLGWSQETYNIFGLDPGKGQPSYEDFVQLIHPDDRDQVMAAADATRASGDRFDMEYRIIRPDGTERLIHSIGEIDQEPEKRSSRLVGTVHDITEQRQAQEELRQYEHIVSSTNDMLALLDKDYVYLAANAAYIQAFAKESDEVIGRTVAEVFGEEFFNAVIKPEAQRCLAGEDTGYQSWFDFPAAGRRYMDVAYSPYLGPDGQVLGFVVTARDITERQRVERATMLSRKVLEAAHAFPSTAPLLRAFVREIKDFTGCDAVGIRILDDDGGIPYQAQEGFCQKFYESEGPLSIKSDECMCINVITGKTDPSLPFYTANGSFYTNSTTRLLAAVSDADRGHTRNACNREGYESVALTPIRMGDAILGLIQLADHRENVVPLETVETLEKAAMQLGAAIQRVRAEEALRAARDELDLRVRQRTAELAQAVEGLESEVRERVSTEEALRRSETKYRDLVQNASSIIMRRDLDGKITFFNEFAQQFFGYSEQDILGRNVIGTIIPERDSSGRDMAAIVGDIGHHPEQNAASEDENMRRNGERVQIAWANRPIRNEHGDIVEILCVGNDITEHRRLEEEVLRISEIERQRIGQDLHDSLGQTLSGVSCLTQVLHRRLLEKSLPEADDVARIESVIGDSVNLARALARGLSPVGIEPNGLMAAIKELSSDMEDLFGTSFVFRCDDDVRVEDNTVATHLYRIAQEAAHNAVRHGKPNEVIISLASTNGDVVLTVADDGVGVPQDMEEADGMGCRIMRHRAKMIGACLEIGPRRRRGVIVTCRLGARSAEKDK